MEDGHVHLPVVIDFASAAALAELQVRVDL
jgi:hypothetical protein